MDAARTIARLILAQAAWIAWANPCAAGGISAGGVALAESQGGVTDRAYVTAPPHALFVVERQSGSFLDCGAGLDARQTDADGRAETGLVCGVTLTETMVIPAAAQSARITVHY
jgi:hypothetical protein